MKKVVFLGHQEKLDGTSFLLVNEVDTHTTVAYDKKKHYLINEKKNDESIETSNRSDALTI